MSRSAFYVLFTASGFAGLIYESIWTHYLKLFLGHAAYAQSLVLVVFMGGMAPAPRCAAGCRSASPTRCSPTPWSRPSSASPRSVFHAVFVGVTDWGYASLLPWLGGEWAALGGKLALACLLILPQSVLLGATFPLMSAGLARAHPASAGESVAMLYFTNSLGAAAGVLASGFVLIGRVGLPGTLRRRRRHQPAARRRVWLLRAAARHAPLTREPTRGDGRRACCSRSRSSPASPRSSTRSAGSACCRWCWAPRRIPSS